MTPVLFVCLHGAAKSVIAAAYFTRFAAERGLPLVGVSAGVEPDAAIPLNVIDGLRADGIDVGEAHPSRVTPAAIDAAHTVIAFGCELELPDDAPPIEQWPEVPAVSDGYAAAHAAIVERVTGLVDRLAGAR
jgi:arsenate reductase (thioredoxin)